MVLGYICSFNRRILQFRQYFEHHQGSSSVSKFSLHSIRQRRSAKEKLTAPILYTAKLIKAAVLWAGTTKMFCSHLKMQENMTVNDNVKINVARMIKSVSKMKSKHFELVSAIMCRNFAEIFIDHSMNHCQCHCSAATSNVILSNAKSLSGICKKMNRKF